MTDKNTMRKLWEDQCNLRYMLAREYGMPSNSLAIANMKRLEKINETRKALSLPPAYFDNFKLITPE